MEWVNDTENTFLVVVSILFLFFYGMQLLWLALFYVRLAFHNSKNLNNTPPVSVIIAARNEEDNLFHFLPKILEQDYHEFEVVVVNHQSIDDSSHILKALQRQYKHLKVIDIKRSKHLPNGKKLPLTIGIKGAKYEHLLFTDADCVPSSRYWIREMAGQFNDEKEIIIGYGPYSKQNGILNRLIRLDTIFIAINYLSFAIAKIPYMAVGRNLAYTKKTFFSVEGFKSHYGLQSGDDDLFIQEAAKNRNYSICINEGAFCYSEAKSTWKEWMKQKSRHFTTTERYRVIKKLLLGIYPLSLLMCYISFVSLLIIGGWNFWMIGLFVFLIVLKWWIFGRCFFKLKEKGLVWALPFWDLLYSLLAPILFYTAEKTNKQAWK